MSHLIHVVDDDRDSRVSTVFLLRALGFEPRPFEDVAGLVASLRELRPGVILLRLSGQLSQAEALLAAARAGRMAWPVIVIADAISASEAVAVMKLGASDVIERPVQAQALTDAIESAARLLEHRLAAADRVQRSRTKIDALSTRELQVLRALLSGLTNKAVAELCSISVRTVEMHRANTLERLGVETMVGAVRIAMEAGIEPLEQDATRSSRPAGRFAKSGGGA